MRRHIGAALLALTSTALPNVTAADPAALSRALEALQGDDTTTASLALTQLEDPVARDIVEWRALRRGGPPWADYIAFLERNADWPGLPFLRATGETAIPGDARPEDVIAYFADQAPRTGPGSLALATAYQRTGNQSEADREAIRGWTSIVMTGDSAARYRSAFGALLDRGAHHVDRLDHLLWENAEDRARAMFPLVPEAWHALAEARLALRARRAGVDGLVAAVPAALQDHPGLAYERFIWRIRSGFWDSAGELMLARSTSRTALGRPAAWANRRAQLARDVMRDGNFDTCYRYAANHFVTLEEDSSAFADLEWIAGYCAYRQGNPTTAIRHFEAFETAVLSPISMGRAGYWLGRAHEAAGNAAAADIAYALGAQFQSSFYGQLAAERGGLPTDPAFLGTEDFGDWRRASFLGNENFHAGLLLYEAGQDWLSERFLTHLTESLSREEAGRLGSFALEIGDAHLAVRIAKRAAQYGHEIMRAYYPIASFVEADLPAPTALVLAIARRESEFDPSVVSPAGALGLMQVMPGTGRDTARALGLPYSDSRMLEDLNYNALLGSAYLAELIEAFDGNPVLVAAAYNAGPSRAQNWVERFGDPRRAEDIVYWIEAIPFTETRNYIMRVTESLPIYEALLTGTLPPSNLSERLQR